jgi:hypothetical protein
MEYVRYICIWMLLLADGRGWIVKYLFETFSGNPQLKHTNSLEIVSISSIQRMTKLMSPFNSKTE